ncbi:MAG: general secretion pathway protein GspB [Rhodoferax sp.]|nr:general secretion pathway protein GspB [Rhodoferax sp.]
MSYILDALKRSEAERNRGAVPGLHSPQVGGPLPHTDRAIPGRGWWFGAAGLLLTGLAAGLWAWRSPSTGVGQAPAQGAVVAGSAATPIQPGPATAVSPTVVMAPPSLPPSPEPAPPAAATPVVANPRAGSQPPPPPQPTASTAAALPALTPEAFLAALRAASAAKRPGPAAPALAPFPERGTPAVRPSPLTTPIQIATPAPATTPTAVAKAVPAPAASASAPLLGELPEDLRRQIPALNITGVVYSENPGQRLLLVNNQVLTQGSAVAPELSVEEIQPRSSVLSFRGTRFRVAH